VASLTICAVSGRGIIRIALEGPTSDVKINTVAIMMSSAALRQPRRTGDVKIEIKSRDQRYDS
jgi:hypothetical protein